MARPQDINGVLGVSMGFYCALMQLAGLLPLFALGTIDKGSLTAEMGYRFTSGGAVPLIVTMNVLVTLAVVLTYPINSSPPSSSSSGRAASGRETAQRVAPRTTSAAAAPYAADGLPYVAEGTPPETSTPARAEATRALSSGGSGTLARWPCQTRTTRPRGRCGIRTVVLLGRIGLRLAVVLVTLLVAIAVPDLGPRSLSPNHAQTTRGDTPRPAHSLRVVAPRQVSSSRSLAPPTRRCSPRPAAAPRHQGARSPDASGAPGEARFRVHPLGWRDGRPRGRVPRSPKWWRPSRAVEGRTKSTKPRQKISQERTLHYVTQTLLRSTSLKDFGWMEQALGGRSFGVRPPPLPFCHLCGRQFGTKSLPFTRSVKR